MLKVACVIMMLWLSMSVFCINDERSPIKGFVHAVITIYSNPRLTKRNSV